MAYDICNKCQRFFIKNGNQYCDECSKDLDHSYKSIEKYLEENPGASIMEIVNSTGVSLKNVNLFVEKGGAMYKDQIDPSNHVNLREEEVNREVQVFHSKEKLKIKNKFTPRRIRR